LSGGNFPVKFTFTLDDMVSSAIEGIQSSFVNLDESIGNVGESADSLETNVNTALDGIQSSISAAATAPTELTTVFDTVSTGITSAIDTAADSASTLQTSFDAASQGIQTSMDSAQGSVSQFADQTQTDVVASQGSVAPTLDATTVSTTQQVSAFGQLASSGAMMVMSVGNVENAQTSLNRANLVLSKANQSVTLDQQAYNKAVLECGPSSIQAKDAASKLSLAQQTAQVDAERVSEAQRNLTNDYMMLGVQTIPTVLGAVSSFSTIMKAYPAISDAVSGATEGLSLSFDGLDTSLLVVAAVVAIGFALYEAYEHCAPFRDAVNEIGGVLEGAFKTAVNDIRDALNFLWNDVLVPIGTFLEDVFVGSINAVMDVLKPMISAVKDVSGFIGGASSAVSSGLKAIGLQGGGIVDQATLAVVGEKEPEAVIPLSQLSGGGVGAGGGGNITIQQLDSHPTIIVQGYTGSVTDLANQLALVINSNNANSLVTAIVQAEGKYQSRLS
jgi:hypothetical protein